MIDLSLLLIANIIPLYILIAMGYIGARYLDVNLHSMAMIAIYFISPVVVFGAITKIEFQLNYLLLPLVLFITSASIGVGAYALASRFFDNKLPNLIGMTSTNGNSGYFGLPIVLALFGPAAAGIYLMMTTFIELCTNTVGYYILARGNFSIRDSLRKVATLPPLHGMILGLVWNFAALPVPDIFYTYWERFAGAWIVIGMMIIGVALGKQDKLPVNWKLIGWMMSLRFIVWPLAMLAFVMLDVALLQLYDPRIHTLLILIGVIPHAANSIAFAAQLKVCPEDTATVVLISTCFALFYVPAAIVLYQLIS